MWRRKKQTKIEYGLNVAGIPTTDTRHYPWYDDMIPVRMTKLTPDWFKKMKAHKSSSGENIPNLKVCPSFVNMMTEGYVIRNASILKISGVQRDGETVAEISTPIDGYISFHDEFMFADNFPFPKNHMHFSMKLQSPFGMLPDREVHMVYLPCWWDENHNNIKAIHGYVRWNPSRALHINVNTFIRRPELGEEYYIPKGAPLVHILFVNPADVKFVKNDKINKTGEAIDALNHATRYGVYGHLRNISENIKDFLVGKS